ncbi:DUF4349 domain-containing protein [Paenibacillus woosongensis]|uniref:DUF4349 domain-containing protein n=1 Tax=Paenibacillus woosongensis TaxID=307580 RepID=A0A7X2YX65_9BACL|nr:DUF4349 domain-containing protein [Paenibacillus woosongensis]MUG43479.1 DUF4349 domain-containing protein [Paenibacillus woosongensis]
MIKKWKLVLCIGTMTLSLLLGGCGSASNNKAADSKADSGFSGESELMSMSADVSMSTATTEQSMPAAGSNEAPVGKQSSTTQAGDFQVPGGSPGMQAIDAPAGLNKKLIYRANVVLEVKDYGKAQSDVRNLVAMSGGYIVEFTENQSQHEQGGTIMLKVPSSGFSSFLDRLEKMEHESLQRSMQGQDVSEEYVDLESRLKVKQAMESRYLQFLKEATKSSQMVEFANELERIQTEIEQIRGRMRYIDQNVAYSTVEIRLYQPEVNQASSSAKGKEPLGHRAWSALDSSLKALSAVIEWIIVILSGALPILLLLGIIAAPIWIVHRKRLLKAREYRLQRKNTVNPPAGTKQAGQAEAADNQDIPRHEDDTD